MNIELSPESEQFLQQVVREGVYASQSQAINAALELLKRRDRLQRELQLGSEQAERGELIDGEEVFRELKQRAREITANARKNP
jgi:antitoxin ParD1/3/4